MEDDILLQKVRKALNQGSTGQLRDQIQANLQKLKKIYNEQLNAARISIQEMEQVVNTCQEIKQNLAFIDKQCKNFPALALKLKPIRDESFKYSQLSITKENFKHIFDVPLNVETTRSYILEGKLLMAHMHLSELDRSRCALLYELHRNPNTNQGDKITLKQYFSEVDKLSDELSKQLWMIISRTLTYVRQDPKIIVSALRIIEREEKQDELAIKRHEATGFMPPNRPKQWRKRVFDILDDAIKERISGNQSEGRTENKLWLIKHLDMIKVMMIQDLRVVKVACEPCFPPSYNIIQEMLKLYHRALRSQLLKLSQLLEGNEYVHLLNWVQSYPQLLKSASLNVSDQTLDALLPEQSRQELIDKYIATIQKNYREWMTNTISREFKDWSSNTPPEDDNAGHYQTTTPVFIFQMIDQHLIVAETVDQSLENRVLTLSTTQLKTFACEYKETIDKYAKIHFCDRERTQLFTPYMIAIANNCSRIERLFHGMEEKFKKKFSKLNQSSLDDGEANNKIFAQALNSFKDLRDEALDYLLQDLFLDIGEQLSQIGSAKWLNNTKDHVEDFVGNICATLADYFRDYRKLEEKNLHIFVYGNKLEKSLARDYIKAFLTKKISLSSQDERKLFFKRFRDDGERLEREIQRYCPITNQIAKQYWQHPRPFNAVKDISDFLRFAGSSSMSIEAMSLKHKYPDISENHLSALLMMCENISRNQARQKVKEMLESIDVHKPDKDQHSIFSEIQITL